MDQSYHAEPMGCMGYGDVRINTIFEGTSQVQQMVISNALLK